LGFETIENITRADIAYRISGKDLTELFVSGAKTLLSAMVDNPDSISPGIKKNIKLRERDLEWLFFNFLQELIFLKDAESLLLVPEKIEISQAKHGYYCKGSMAGEKIEAGKHHLKVDVKAVTMHKYKLTNHDGIWVATVVLDV
jgi:SHS2 domain-containing protein